jgi:hypothetical protein
MMDPKEPAAVKSPAERACEYPKALISAYKIDPTAITVIGAGPAKAENKAQANTAA